MEQLIALCQKSGIQLFKRIDRYDGGIHLLCQCFRIAHTAFLTEQDQRLLIAIVKTGICQRLLDERRLSALQ